MLLEVRKDGMYNVRSTTSRSYWDVDTLFKKVESHEDENTSGKRKRSGETAKTPNAKGK